MKKRKMKRGESSRKNSSRLLKDSGLKGSGGFFLSFPERKDGRDEGMKEGRREAFEKGRKKPTPGPIQE